MLEEEQEFMIRQLTEVLKDINHLRVKDNSDKIVEKITVAIAIINKLSPEKDVRIFELTRSTIISNLQFASQELDSIARQPVNYMVRTKLIKDIKNKLERDLVIYISRFDTTHSFWVNLTYWNPITCKHI